MVSGRFVAPQDANGAVMNELSRISLEDVVEALAERVKLKLSDRLNDRGRGIIQRLLTVTEAARYLGRSKASVQHMVSAQTLPVVRSGRRVFLDIRELDGWIEQNREG